MSSESRSRAASATIPVLLAALLAVTTIVLLRRASAFAPSPVPAAPALPSLGEVPEFALTDAAGKTVRRADLAGSPWIAAFIYTRCPGQCPMMTARMRSLERRLPGVRFVSFSVDPEDSPAVLARYAKENGADWLFLTGKGDAVRRLSKDGFRLPAAPGAAGEMIHSDRFVLIDRAGKIRGYFDGLDDSGLAALAQAAKDPSL